MDSVVACFVVLGLAVGGFVVPAVVVTIDVVTSVVDDSHLTLAGQSQYLNCELNSNPLGQLLM